MSWLVLILVGVLVGALLGLVGAGGGIVAVPALMLLGGATAAQASALSLAAVTAGAIVGLLGRRGGGPQMAVDWRAVLLFLLAGIPTAAWGAATAPLLPNALLTWLLLAVLAVALWRQLAGRKKPAAVALDASPASVSSSAAAHADAFGTGPTTVRAASGETGDSSGDGDTECLPARARAARRGEAAASGTEVFDSRSGSDSGSEPDGDVPNAFPVTCWINQLMVGGIVGYLTGLLGVGGGFLIVPALTVLLGLSLKRAASTSLAIIVGTSLSGIVTHLLNPSSALAPDYPVQALVLAGATAVVALIGARLSVRLSERITRLVFLGALALAIVGVAISAVLAL